jgi:hypothetical protein
MSPRKNAADPKPIDPLSASSVHHPPGWEGIKEAFRRAWEGRHVRRARATAEAQERSIRGRKDERGGEDARANPARRLDGDESAASDRGSTEPGTSDDTANPSAGQIHASRPQEPAARSGPFGRAQFPQRSEWNSKPGRA